MKCLLTQRFLETMIILLDFLRIHTLLWNLTLAKDGESPKCSKVNNRLRGSNGIPIGVVHENPLLYARIYEVEYIVGRKSGLSTNLIAIDILAQLYEEGDQYALLNAIVDHHTDES